MKTPLLSSLALGLLLSAPLHGQKVKDDNPFNDPNAQIRVQVEFIEITQDQFTELMYGDKPPANDTELRKRVGKMVKDGKAKVIENLLCTATTGEMAASESIEEYIYPTEYDPSEFHPIPMPDPEDPKPVVPVDMQASAPNPTAFETRNLGSTLEVKPQLAVEDGFIQLSFVAEIVVHVGNTTWAEFKNKHGETPILMPTFYTLRFNGELNLADGKPMLATALTPKDDNGKTDFSRKVLTFARATVIQP